MEPAARASATSLRQWPDVTRNHSFLISMVAFEALLEEEGENIGKLARRISCLLSKSKADRGDIHRKFDDGGPDTFGKLRNLIAHGSPSLDSSLVKAEYPVLFRFLQKAIAEMLTVPSGAIGSRRTDKL